MFSINIPALPLPEGPVARARLRALSAPAIAVNDPITVGALAAASNEFSERRQCLGRTDITSAEVLAAEVRMHTVFVASVISQHYGGNSTMNAAPLQNEIDVLKQTVEAITRQAALDVELVSRRLDAIERNYQQENRRLDDIERDVQEANKRLDAIEGTLRAMENRVDGLEVYLIGVRNRERRAFNRTRHGDDAQQLVPLQPLQPLLKENAQDGPGLPGLSPAQPPVVLRGAELPSPPFPATIQDISAMPLAAIHELATMMNDDFGIVEGDDLDTCRWKLTRALSG